MKQFLWIAACFIGMTSYAQTTVHGKVFDERTKAPLSGATINLGNKGSILTDKEGNFTFECGQAGRLTITLVGYESIQRVVRNCNEDLIIGLIPISNALNEVEITTVAPAKKELIYQPSSIAKLNITDIKRGTGLYLDDAINTNVTGVYMQRRSVSAGQSFNIRGYGAGTRGTNGPNSNFDNQGSKVYLNGIPVTDAEGITLMDDIDFGSIGNAEIIKGPAGTLYGLAIAGVVNLHTIRPEPGKTSVGQEAMVGSYGLRRYTTYFQMGMQKSSLLLNYGRMESDGYMPHNASHKDYVNLAAEFNVNPRQTVNTYFGFSNSYDQRAGELTVGQYDTLNYSGNPAYIKNDAHSENIGFRAGLTHTYRFTNTISNTTTVFGSSVSNNASSAGGWTDKAPVNYGVRSTLDTRFLFGSGVGLSGITGVEAQQQRAQTIGYAMVLDSNNLAGYNRIGATRSNQFSITGTSSFFTEWNLSLPLDFSVTAGLGMSNMNIELNDRVYLASQNRVPSKFEKSYDHLFSPRAAINKVIAKQVSLYASYSVGYKAPVSAYFFIPFVSGAAGTGMVNPNLKPEKGTQYEVGTKGVLLKHLVYEIAAFQAVFENKMTAVAVPNAANTATLYSYVTNGGRLNNKGVEAQVRFLAYESGRGFFRTIRPFANATYTHFRYEDFVYQSADRVKHDYSGLPVAGVPKWTFNAGFDLTTNPGLYANAYFNYRDPVAIRSEGDLRTHAYHLFNGKIGFRHSLGEHFDVDAYTGAQNITGEQYYIQVFVNQIPDAYLPAPRHAVIFGGINLKYNF